MEERREKAFLYKGLWQEMSSGFCTIACRYFRAIRQGIISTHGLMARLRAKRFWHNECYLG